MKIKIMSLVFAFAVLTSAGAVQGKSGTPLVVFAMRGLQHV